MDPIELFRFFYIEPPILLKELQDIIGDYTVDVFDRLPMVSMELDTKETVALFICPHQYYEDGELVKAETSITVNYGVKLNHVRADVRAGVCRAFLNLYYRENCIESPYLLAKHIRRIYKGPTYDIAMYGEEPLLMTEPFLEALLRRVDKKIEAFDAIMGPLM